MVQPVRMERVCDIFAVCAFVGHFFGIYCNVVVLTPATPALAITCSVVALLDGESAVSLASLIIVPSVALQGGCVIGLTSRDLLAPFLARGAPAGKRYSGLTLARTFLRVPGDRDHRLNEAADAALTRRDQDKNQEEKNALRLSEKK